jgi:hypothetical protein
VRARGKVDANQAAIVQALRNAGCFVQSLASVGKGCPDLLVLTPATDWIVMEVKDGSKPPSARKLTADEAAWHRQAAGSVYIVESVADAFRAAGIKG